MRVIALADPYGRRTIERLESEAKRQAGLLDYVAMMVDVELPDNSETESEKHANDE